MEVVANRNLLNDKLKQQYKGSHNVDNAPPVENSPPLDPKAKKSKLNTEGICLQHLKFNNVEKDLSPRGMKRTREEKRVLEEPLQEALASAVTGAKRTKKKKTTVQVERPSLRYNDVGGIDHVLQEIRELVEYPFTHPEIYRHLGVEPARGILLFGPPGSGKTMLATAIAGELGLPFLRISAPEIVSGVSGESEAKLRQIFKDAVRYF
jgi:SpoVK/Ycf46/Vps4 family AAA+-type ATPase